MKFYLIIAAMALSATLARGEHPGKWGKLTDYPLSDKLWIAGYSGMVEVDPITELVALRHGEMRWEVEDGAVVREGDVLAYFDVEKIDHSSKQLALDELAQDIKLKELKWAHAEKIRGLKDQVADLQSAILKMELSPQERKLIGEVLAKRLEQQRAEKTEDLMRLKEKLDPGLLAKQLEIEERELAQKLERGRAEHEALKRSLALYADQDGTLARLKVGSVRAGMKVGELVQKGNAILKLNVTDPHIRSTPADKLVVSVPGPRGQMAEGRFSHIEGQNLGGLGPKVYIFKLEAAGEARLDGEFSGDRMVRIYRQLEKEARIVTKSKMLFSEPEKIHEMGWRRFLKTVWPDAEIVQIGPVTIAMEAN